MGVFIHNDITDRGRIMLGDAQVGATFEATKIVMGSGFIPSGYTARTMTGVVAPVIELAINKARRAGDGTVTFGGMFSNETITEAFYFREFALYARVKRADGTYSDEVCYSYGNAGDNADLLPAYSAGAVVEKQMDLVTYIGNDTAVSLKVQSGIRQNHAETHAVDGEDPLTPTMIGAVYAKPLGSYGAETTIAEQVQHWFDQHIRWGIFHAALCADLPPETINWDHGVEFKVLSGFRVKVEAVSLEARTFVRHYDAYTKSWVNDWVDETGVPKGIPVGADLNDYKEFGEYYMISGADTLLNSPTVFGSISLDVKMTGSYGVGVVQTVKDHKGNVYVRSYAAESDSDWTEWDRVVTESMMPYEVATAELI